MKIRIAELGKRIFALFTDLVLTIMLSLCLQTLVCMPIAMNTTNYNEAVFEYYEMKLDSHLFEVHKDSDSLSLITSNYDYHLNKFYGDYIGDIDIYNQDKLESGLFEMKEGNVVIKESSSNAELNDFYLESLEKAERKFYDNDLIIKYTQTITLVSWLTIMISSVISITIFFLLFPLFLKNGSTLGKMVFGLGLTNKKGYSVKKIQIVIRFLVFLLFEFILSIFMFGLPLLVSFTMTVFSKKGVSLHDYFALTIVVDAKSSPIYRTEEEFIANYKKINSNPDLSLYKKLKSK
ncbi:MAG: RDD family protein [Bacilli bacterium]|nr:RDD family protein [Bacilli bacterium]